MSTPVSRPLIALTLGDPAGIGPEIACAALASPRVKKVARVLAIGPERFRPEGVPIADASTPVGEAAWLATPERGEVELGRTQAEGGAAALAALRAGADLAAEERVDALVTGPVSKAALHLAGERVEGQTQLLGRWAGREDEVEMLACVRALRVLPLTRHMPLRDALDRITTDAVVRGIERLHTGLRELGIERPRLALAGLNPHAGEGGLLGEEEDTTLRPAVERASAAGIDVAGPESPDTVFVRGLAGAFDGVLALYHDQAFLPTKIAAPGEGVTLLLGLPYLRLSPAHGTAFDIAGQGIADPTNLIVAIEEAARLAVRRRAAQSAARVSM